MALVRIALIGVGRWGRAYLSTLLSLGERCRLTHLVTRHPEHAQLIPYPVTVLHEWRDVTGVECEAVIIATPPHLHAEMLEACLEAGKPCIVEKPLCLTVEQARRLQERVERSGVPVLVDHTHVFHPAYRVLKQQLQQRQQTVRLIISEGGALGPFRSHTSALWDWGPHDVSLCIDLVGQSPRQIAVLGGPEDAEGAPELMSVKLVFPSGVCAWIQVGRLFPWKRRTLSVFTDTHLYRLDDMASPQLTVAPFTFAQRDEPRTQEEALVCEPILVPHSQPPLTSAVEYFLDGLAGGDRTYFGTALAVEVVRVLAACETALKAQTNNTGQRARRCV